MKFATFLASTSLLVSIIPFAASAKQTGDSGSVGSNPISTSVAHPGRWPVAHSQGLVDPQTEARITRLMARMSLEEMIGQMIQADIASISPDDLSKYPLGSILAGGSSPPLGAPDRSAMGPWLATARAFEKVAMAPRPGHHRIPLLIGIDAVHGNSNVVGATLFPHNSGLGAMYDPALMRRIGKATGEETIATGFNWAFGPTLAVPQDTRWGRSFEGYSEDPAVARAYAGPMVEGLQGAPGAFGVARGHVAASAKHFLGDGGTHLGVDQGDAQVDEATLIHIHSAGYPPAIDAGVMTVMASYNSWNGQKMHGNKSLLTDVLKGRMGFEGFVIGDWNGHAQLPGCSPTDCPASFNAGLDMAMAPDGWRGMFENTLAEVKAGQIPMSRVKDAVRRILRVKYKLGLFAPESPWVGRAQVIGSAGHRAIARQAVRESLVLLKNEGVLPIKPSAHVLVAGDAGNDIGRQSGGWTLSWQGDGNTNADFPGATSIFAGIKAGLARGGGSAEYAADGAFQQKPDVAIVVFGEQPYAEMRGDIHTLEFQPGDKQALALLKKLKSQGIPVVSVFLSGRPLWVNPEINQSDAFVAGWFPGSEGAGVADVLIGGQSDFRGTLSFNWPRNAGQFALHRGGDEFNPLFPLGYGLAYKHPGHVGQLDEAPGFDASQANTSIFFMRGKVPSPFGLTLAGAVTRSAVDSATMQEGALRLDWQGPGSATIAGPVLAFERETNADLNLQVTYRLEAPISGAVSLKLGGGAVGLAGVLKAGGWQVLKVPLKCFTAHGGTMGAVKVPFALEGDTGVHLSIADIRLASDPALAVCPQ